MLFKKNMPLYYGKNETIKSDSIKREERIKNIDIELRKLEKSKN